MSDNDLQANFLHVIPAYLVSWRPPYEAFDRQIRVPRDDLTTFIKILTFNGIEDFRVVKEKIYGS